VVRAQAPDEQRPVTGNRPLLSIPSPEILGIVNPQRSETIHGMEMRQRLDRLGVVCTNLEKPAQGGFRFICILPTARPARNHRVEAVADTEAEAIRLVVERSEQWAGALR
jgi:hypothetical protein